MTPARATLLDNAAPFVATHFGSGHPVFREDSADGGSLTIGVVDAIGSVAAVVSNAWVNSSTMMSERRHRFDWLEPTAGTERGIVVAAYLTEPRRRRDGQRSEAKILSRTF